MTHLVHFSAEDLGAAESIPIVVSTARRLERKMTLEAMQARLRELGIWTCFQGSVYARKQLVALRLATVEYLLS